MIHFNCTQGKDEQRDYVPYLQNLLKPPEKLNFVSGQKLCVQCYKELAKLPQDEPSSPSPETDNSSNSSLSNSSEPGSPGTAQGSGEYGTIMQEDLKEHELPVLNESTTLLGKLPLHIRNLIQEKYPKKKVNKIGQTVAKKLKLLVSDELPIPGQEIEAKARDFQEIVEQLMVTFNTCKTKSEKVRVMTVTPMSWTIWRTAKEFGVTFHMTRVALHTRLGNFASERM